MVVSSVSSASTKAVSSAERRVWGMVSVMASALTNQDQHGAHGKKNDAQKTIDPNALLKLAFQLSEAEVFSPLIQPSIDVVLNDNQTGALVSLEGTANTAFDAVYWRIDARLPDALGEITDLNHNLAIWNTDLL